MNQAFTTFAKCHNTYERGDQLPKDDIHTVYVCIYIKNFLHLYQQTFPSATVLPKMHLLEQHVVPWLNNAAVNAITRAYTSIPHKVSQVQCILQEHHGQVCPI